MFSLFEIEFFINISEGSSGNSTASEVKFGVFVIVRLFCIALVDAAVAIWQNNFGPISE